MGAHYPARTILPQVAPRRACCLLGVRLGCPASLGDAARGAMAPKAAVVPMKKRKSGKSGRYKIGARKGKPDLRVRTGPATRLLEQVRTWKEQCKQHQKELAEKDLEIQRLRSRLAQLEADLRSETNRRLEIEGTLAERNPRYRSTLAGLRR